MKMKPARGAVTLTSLTLAVMAALPWPTSAAPLRPLANALPPGHPSCHASVLGAAELAAHPDRRVAAISLERTARDLAAERKWGRIEQFDDTPIVSATLRVRFRGDPVTHSTRLECVQGEESGLVCMSSACDGGQIRIEGEGRGPIAISVGGTLKSGRFIGHYIHLDESCEGRAGGPIVLESGEDDRRFSLLPASKEARR
jgi:hypothetical protein